MAFNSLILCFFIYIISMSCFADDYVIIKSKTSGLVLDGNEYYVKGKPEDGSIGQKWILTPTDLGRFEITNARNGYDLDGENGCKLLHNLIVYRSNNGLNQKFYINRDGTIGTACNDDLIVELKDGYGQLGSVENSCSSGDVFFEIEAAN